MGGRLLASGSGAGLLLLLLCGHGVRASRYVEDTDRFPGWKGALPMPGEKPAAAGKEAALSQEAEGVSLALGDAGSVRLACHCSSNLHLPPSKSLLADSPPSTVPGPCLRDARRVCGCLLSTAPRAGGVARGDGGGVLEAASFPPQELSE